MLNRSVVPCLMAMAVTAHTLAGDLNPPAGPIAPTGRFGPRIEINQANTPGDVNSLFRIASPGSYYIGGNITGVTGKSGIEIGAGSVTIDLMGFELRGVPGSLDGITIDAGHDDLTIIHGTVTLWGSEGIDVGSIGGARGSHIRSVHVSKNGVGGIRTGFAPVITECSAIENGGTGIQVGAGGVVENCVADSNSGHGFFVSNRSVIRGCTSISNGFTGITAFSSSFVQSCFVGSNVRDGISVRNGCYVLNNMCDVNGNGGSGAGIVVNGTENRIDGNNTTSNDRGVDVNAGGNLIVRNSARGNTTDYDIIAGNAFGSFQNLPAGGPIVANVIAGNGFNLPHAWSNFIY